VTETSVATVDGNEADMMVAAAAASESDVVMVETEVMPAPEPVDTEVATVVATEMEMADEAVMSATATTMVDGESPSLVAMSEREVTDNIVVVPDYMAAADISTSLPTVESGVAVESLDPVEPPAEEAMEVAEIKQETLVDEDGNLVASTTSLVETTTVVREAAASESVDVEGVETGDVLVIAPAPEAQPEPEIEVAAVEPVQTASAQTQTVQNTAPAISYDELSFDDLFDASGPDATLQPQAVSAPAGQSTVIGDATFTTTGNDLIADTLAAIIRFGHGSASLGAKEREIIAQLAAIHRQTGGPIRLVGHASRSGGGLADADQALVNFEISLDRADAVAQELIRNGVPAGDIFVEAAAADDSMAAAAGIQNEAVDRRVEVFFGV